MYTCVIIFAPILARFVVCIGLSGGSDVRDSSNDMFWELSCRVWPSNLIPTRPVVDVGGTCEVHKTSRQAYMGIIDEYIFVTEGICMIFLNFWGGEDDIV